MKEFLRRLSDFLRGGFLVALVLAAAALAVWRLLTLQIVRADEGEKTVQNVARYEQVIPATRGEIVDAAGEPIVSNKIGYNLIIEKAYFPSDNARGNEVLLKTANLLQKENYEWNDTSPITRTAPYEFEKDREGDAEQMRTLLRLNDYATAQDCFEKLVSDYEISEDYTEAERRTIAGIRYEMLLRDFSMSNVFYLANDIDIEVVMRVKEMRTALKGVNIVEEAIRTIERGDVLPHEIGYVGPIYSAEEYEALQENGGDYALSDMVGKSGLEEACEARLRGRNGTKEITVTDGEVTSVAVKEEPVGGHTIQLTVQSGFQNDLQKLLEDYCAHLRSTDRTCAGVRCGALVALDTRSNGVLGMATLPTYNLTDLLEDYSGVSAAADSPLVNRATDGLYRPGSTFKTITATAGLNTGTIGTDTSFYCNRSYRFIDTVVHCTGSHGYTNVTRALTVSCNIFFYELAQRLGIDTLVEYERLYGLGAPLGLESGDSGGYVACPETFEELGMDWYVGELLQAAIGQSEVAVTPLQMAVVASTIANNGVRYRPHLIGSVWNNAMTEQTETYEGIVDQTITPNADYVFPDIETGMLGAARTAMPAKYDLNRIGFPVALKTGTPQSPRGTDSFVIGYAPADNPEIAFCGVVEGGKNAKYMVKELLTLYAKYYPDSDIAARITP